MSLYDGRVEVRPHKYTTGHYLVVSAPAGGDATEGGDAFRLVFETDGEEVLRVPGRPPAGGGVRGRVRVTRQASAHPSTHS